MLLLILYWQFRFNMICQIICLMKVLNTFYTGKIKVKNFINGLPRMVSDPLKTVQKALWRSMIKNKVLLVCWFKVLTALSKKLLWSKTRWFSVSLQRWKEDAAVFWGVQPNDNSDITPIFLTPKSWMRFMFTISWFTTFRMKSGKACNFKSKQRENVNSSFISITRNIETTQTTNTKHDSIVFFLLKANINRDNNFYYTRLFYNHTNTWYFNRVDLMVKVFIAPNIIWVWVR